MTKGLRWCRATVAGGEKSVLSLSSLVKTSVDDWDWDCARWPLARPFPRVRAASTCDKPSDARRVHH